MHLCTFLQLDVEYGRDILRGVGEFCRRRPDIRISWFLKPRTYQPRLIKQIKPDGIIAKISTAEEEKTLRRLTGIPVINVSGQLINPKVCTVNTDDLLVGRMGFQHLKSRGYRRFAFVGSQHHAASRLRLQGYSREIASAGHPPVEVYSISKGELDRPTMEKSLIELSEWIRELPKPIGVMTFTDRLAMQVEMACRQLGVRIPDDVAVLGVGNDQMRLVFPSIDLSSIHLNARRIGSVAAEYLISHLEQGAPLPRETLIGPAKIHARRSTNRLEVGDEILELALNYIQEHLGNPTSVGEIAKAVGVSRRSLEMRFMKVMGTSVYAEVQRQHFERAMELMADPQLNITEIAFEAGFTSAQTFSTMFRRRFGQSPTDYRSGLLGQVPARA